MLYCIVELLFNLSFEVIIMNENQYKFYYEQMLNNEQKAKCDEITAGKKYNQLSIQQKVQLSLICIPSEINFFSDDENKEVRFSSDTKEYKLLENMEIEEWEVYIEIMSSRGVTVEFDSIDDDYVIS